MNEQESAQFLGDIELLGEGLALASAQTPTHARLYQRVFERIRERAAQLVNGEAAMQEKLAEAQACLERALRIPSEPKPEPEPEPVAVKEAEGG